MKHILIILGVLLLVGCSVETQTMVKRDIPDNAQVATFAGGCFWCIEAQFDDLPGIYAAVSGYTGGTVANPTYIEVISGTTGHREAVQVFFDESTISYEKLLDMFWKSIDATDAGGQFADRGQQYTTAIYYHTEEQKKLAQESKKEMQQYYDEPIVTQILPASAFYEAEEYHQDYAKKKAAHYKAYETGSGRKGFLEKKWG